MLPNINCYVTWDLKDDCDEYAWRLSVLHLVGVRRIGFGR